MSTNYKVDMHLYSRWSDGRNTVSELFNLVKKEKLSGAVLTDHDSIGGLEEFMILCRQNGIDTTTGVEISATLLSTGLSVDILGYGFNLQTFSKNSTIILHNLQVHRNQLRKILNLYKLRGVMDFTLEKLTEKFHLPCLASNKYWVIAARAEILVKKHNFEKAEAVKKAEMEIKKGGSFYEWREHYINVISAIDCIKKNGGIAVWAHPAKTIERIKNDCVSDWERTFNEIARKMADAGLGGLEVYTPYNRGSDVNLLLKSCKRYNLHATGGSDYHGEYGSHECHVGAEWIDYKKFVSLFLKNR